ncbi:MAG: amino acid ABC transporter substrate-binding protein [Chloroflexi bacterium]|nr:amino acid ABC transporter substrate-binding protein [Chloroflexota bacterium]
MGRMARVVLAMVVVLAFVASACTSSQASVPTEIPIGAVVPLTGKYASGGSQIKAGYELAVDDINKAGGVFVKQFNKKIPFKLTVLDDTSDPSQTVDRLEKLYSNDKVMAYLGGFGSDLHAAGAPIGDKNKVPYLGVAFALHSIHQKGLKYLFSTYPKSPDIAKDTFTLLNTIPQDKRPKKIAIFQEATDWGIEQSALWKKEAAANGYEIAVDEQYAPGSKDYSSMIMKAKSAGVDAVFALPNPPDGMAIMKQIRELGLNAKFYLLVRAPDGITWGQDMGQSGNYVLGAAMMFFDDLKYPGIKEANERFKAKFGRPMDPIAGPAYQLVQVLADAISRADKYDRTSIRDAIAKTDMMTIEGPVSFRPDGTANIVTQFYQWQDGKQVLVWPKDQAEKPLAYPAKPWNER